MQRLMESRILEKQVIEEEGMVTRQYDLHAHGLKPCQQSFLCFSINMRYLEVTDQHPALSHLQNPIRNQQSISDCYIHTRTCFWSHHQPHLKGLRKRNCLFVEDD